MVGPEAVIPHDTTRIAFLVTPVPGLLRYRLAGYTGYDEWIQRSGQMFVGIRFFKEDGDFIDEIRFWANGRSPGWNGNLESSEFTPRQEKIEPPHGASLAELFITSAGPPSSVGIMAVADFDLYHGDTSLHIGRDWRRLGTRPSMASIQKVRDRDTLVIDDNDISTHADWVSSRDNIQPGEPLTLQWKEIFSNGIGGPMTVFHNRLPIGHYRFEVEETDLAGTASRSYSIDIRVPPPFWKTWWFWSICCIGIALLGVAGGLLWSRMANRKLDEERRRIARDLHDDLGARISQISLASSYAEEFAENDRTKSGLGFITGLAQELSISLSESVWMLNSQNGHLASLVEFLCRLVASLCKPSDVPCRIEADTFGKHLPISNHFRRHVSLAVREAVTNALRHSGADEIRFSIKISSSMLTIHINDNGKGFHPDVSKGNGIANMQQRMASLKGRFLIEAPETGGTRVVFEIPLMHAAKIS